MCVVCVCGARILCDQVFWERVILAALEVEDTHPTIMGLSLPLSLSRSLSLSLSLSPLTVLSLSLSLLSLFSLSLSYVVASSC